MFHVEKSVPAKRIGTFDQEKCENATFLRSSEMSVLLRNVQNILIGNEYFSCWKKWFCEEDLEFETLTFGIR